MKDQEVLKFEPLVERLRKIIDEIEDEDTDIESSLAAYEEGVKLVRRAQRYLAEAEQRVSVLEGDPPEQNEPEVE